MVGFLYYIKETTWQKSYLSQKKYVYLQLLDRPC